MNDKSKKKKNNCTNKKELWNIFDSEICDNKEPLECIYRACGNRENCELVVTEKIVIDVVLI